MTRIIFILLFLMSFLPHSVRAQEQELDKICRYLQAHKAKAQPENGAEYVPGIDVHGNTVAPADLNDQSDFVLETITIPLTLDLADLYNLKFPQGVELEPVIGMITINRQGRVIWGDKDLTVETVALCLEKALKTEDAALDDLEGEGNAGEDENGTGDNIDNDETNEGLIWGESHLE